MAVRSGAIDAVRVIGVLAVVAGHVWGTEWAWLTFYPWHVPVFFFLTGYLWKSGRSLRTEVTNRSKSLLKPYVFWFVVIFVIFISTHLVVGSLTRGDIVFPLYGGYFATRPFSTFWFVFALFSSAVLYRLVERAPLWARLTILGVALLAGVFFGDILARTPLAIGTALPVLLFIAAGQAARWAQAWVHHRVLLGLGLILASELVIWTRLVAPVDLKQGDWGTPLASVCTAIAISWGLVLLAQALYEKLSAKPNGITTALALTGFTIVLAHPTVLWVFDADPENGSILVFAVAVAVPMAVGAIALRTPASQWLTGIPARTKAAPAQQR